MSVTVSTKVAKPLFWRKDPDEDGAGKFIATGFGGCYVLEKQKDGTWLLWDADDGFRWTQHDTATEAKSAAEADYQRIFALKMVTANV